MGLKVSILNSRQGIAPCLADAWIQNTIQAVRFIKDNGYTLISSVGMPTWEIVTTLGAMNKIPMILYLPIKNKQSIVNAIEQVKHNYDLTYPDIQYVPLIGKTSEKSIRIDRDSEIVSNSDIIIPVSIRSKGNLNKLLQSISQNRIIDLFECPHKNRDKMFSYSIDPDKVNPEISKLQNKYFFHWTKSTHNKRENEKSIKYYMEILNSQTYPRTALNNLHNIVLQKTIFASSKDIPARTQVVSFTDCPPELMSPLFRWRSRHQQMSFEPYGIAFEKKLIENKLIQVQYYADKSELNPSTPRWQTHSRGKKTDWSVEREYRHKADFNFSDIDLKNIFCITRYKKEADEFTKLTGIKTIPYTIE